MLLIITAPSAAATQVVTKGQHAVRLNLGQLQASLVAAAKASNIPVPPALRHVVAAAAPAAQAAGAAAAAIPAAAAATPARAVQQLSTARLKQLLPLAIPGTSVQAKLRRLAAATLLDEPEHKMRNVQLKQVFFDKVLGGAEGYAPQQLLAALPLGPAPGLAARHPQPCTRCARPPACRPRSHAGLSHSQPGRRRAWH